MPSQEKFNLPACIIHPHMFTEIEDAKVLQLLSKPQEFDVDSIREYLHAITLINLARLAEVAYSIQAVFHDFDLFTKIAITVPGSDGKLEKGPFLKDMYSPLELLILITEDLNITFLNQALLAIHPTTVSIDPRFEYKSLAETTILSGYNGDPQRAWPDRIINAHLLFGEENIHITAMERVQIEWNSIAKVRKSVKNYLNQFLNTSTTGKSRNSIHFSLEKGNIYYDKSKFVMGLKYGPIRALQVFLNKFQLEKGLKVVGTTNTIQKLNLLFPQDLDVPEVEYAYIQALRIYHWQQFEAKNGRDANLQIQPGILTSIIDPIYQFISKQAKNIEHSES